MSDPSVLGEVQKCGKTIHDIKIQIYPHIMLSLQCWELVTRQKMVVTLKSLGVNKKKPISKSCIYSSYMSWNPWADRKHISNLNKDISICTTIWLTFSSIALRLYDQSNVVFNRLITVCQQQHCLLANFLVCKTAFCFPRRERIRKNSYEDPRAGENEEVAALESGVSDLVNEGW